MENENKKEVHAALTELETALEEVVELVEERGREVQANAEAVQTELKGLEIVMQDLDKEFSPEPFDIDVRVQMPAKLKKTLDQILVPRYDPTAE